MNAREAAGAEVEWGDPVEQPFFTSPGRILRVSGADIQILEYDSLQTLDADSTQIVPDGGSVGTSMLSWMATPHFFKSHRMLVLYVGDHPAILDLLNDALGE